MSNSFLAESSTGQVDMVKLDAFVKAAAGEWDVPSLSPDPNRPSNWRQDSVLTRTNQFGRDFAAELPRAAANSARVAAAPIVGGARLLDKGIRHIGRNVDRNLDTFGRNVAERVAPTTRGAAGIGKAYVGANAAVNRAVEKGVGGVMDFGSGIGKLFNPAEAKRQATIRQADRQAVERSTSQIAADRAAREATRKSESAAAVERALRQYR